jgi:ribose transport system substrate-binding protein
MTLKGGFGMKTNRIALIFFMVVIMLLPVVTVFAQTKAYNPQKQWTLGYSQLIFTHPYVRWWMEEQVKADKDFNIKTITKNAEANIETQLADIDALIALKPDVIAVHPVDVVACEKAVQKALDAGIPTLSTANKINVKGNINCLFKQYETFSQFADLVAAYLKGKGYVAMVVGPVGNYASDMRQKGFLDGIKKYPGIKLLDWQASNWSTEKSVQITEDWINKFDKIDVIVYADDQLAAPAIETIKSYKKDIKVIGYSGTEDGLKAIADGNMLMTGLAAPPQLAWFCASTAYLLYRGVKLPEDMYIDTPVVMNQTVANTLSANGFNLSKIKYATPDKVEAMINEMVQSFSKAATDKKYNLK